MILAIWLTFKAGAQVIFKTIAPVQPVMVGESFPVQYVLEDIEPEDEFAPPSFTGFQLVSGPYTYTGLVRGINGSRRLKNIVYTLVAVKPGRYVIEGATAKVNGNLIKSGNAIIDVIQKKKSMDKVRNDRLGETASAYFLRPGEDPYEKIRKNLFMKVSVDRRTCYVGEPVVATFRLYSRLESKSDIVKNPGFYGFTVQDIINLNDNLTTTETINGKPFDVHTVRKVQLYPLQEGQYAIDPMEVTNKVEFSKSAMDRKTEQEITEGVYKQTDAEEPGNIVTYENSVSTEKIAITVKPYPEKHKPPVFAGATGKFSIRASLKKNELAKNEEGTLIITLVGKGNFPQISAPAINWPAGLEGFEAAITDSLDKTRVPLKGSRSFHYAFVASKAGNYVIPGVDFSFFDPDSNQYKTIFIAPLEIKVNNQPVKEAVKKAKVAPGNDENAEAIWVTVVGLALLFIVSAFLWFRHEPENMFPVKSETVMADPVMPIEQLLQPAYFAFKAADNRFYGLLQKCIWDYLGLRLQLYGSKMNKQELQSLLQEKKLPAATCRDLVDILERCEASLFTKAQFNDNKEELLERTRTVLEQVREASL